MTHANKARCWSQDVKLLPERVVESRSTVRCNPTGIAACTRLHPRQPGTKLVYGPKANLLLRAKTEGFQDDWHFAFDTHVFHPC
jgi:hypothetical protein